jgi:anthranilate synthase component 1
MELRPINASSRVLRQLAYQDPERFPVLLDSAGSGPLGRYSILAAFPRRTLWQDESGQLHSDGDLPVPGTGFLTALERAWRQEQCDAPAPGAESTDLPFRGGWLVFLGYELAGEIEPRLPYQPLPRRDPAAPAAFALRVAAGLVYDHERGQLWAFGEPGETAAVDELERTVTVLVAPTGEEPAGADLEIIEEDPECYRRRVEAALEYIRAGDIYQANLSRPWRAWLPAGVDRHRVASRLYERLRLTNPAPFAALVRFRGWHLLSSSPERLVRMRGSRIETRPIAGTRPRSGLGEQHAHEISALIEHPKERAEHVMLIDLERNDLGRVCRGGSVHVDEFMQIESYPHVHHIVSNVCGERLPQATPIDVLRAMFPGGTITGCPKFRCMQIIAELEGEARQAYTGSLGFINCDGSMDFNILIRSLTLSDAGLEFRTGAGIVADSDWQRELAETRAKARGLLAGLAGSRR